MIQKEINKINSKLKPLTSFILTGGKELSLARNVVGAFIVCDLNIDVAKASKLMNRDRTSFYFYQKKHNEYMSDHRIYPEYVKLYEIVYDKYMNDKHSLLKDSNTKTWFEQIEDIKEQQKAIDRKMKHIENEAKMLGL